ncbi:MAG: hypothetical protein AUH05_05180 [Ktedonobacter sp. 13_2_20CM_53_11]|nr:MAG: hypothetical protein AUH05_05180 [Ktedonobacter sp. 13_2_20CM_53_11]
MRKTAKPAKPRNIAQDLLVLTVLAPHVALAKILWRPGASTEGWRVFRVEHTVLQYINLTEPVWRVDIRHESHRHIVYDIIVTGGDVLRWLDKERQNAQNSRQDCR